MPNKNYNNGRAFEYRVRDYLYEQGAVQVIRAAGSHTKIDLTAFFPAMEGGVLLDPLDSWDDNPAVMPVKIPCVWMVQCKRDGRITKAEREEVRRIAHESGAQPYVFMTGPNGRGIDYKIIT